ncbi:MAG: Gfo/Idh/MocA family oxidoreductase [Bryobacterales bacterium]|nr:Gfo/Idh/MocA family oxidoreductase [Bryobacterales bacterium]
MSEATIHRVGIIMNGVTGRMGTNQHLIRSIKAIIDQGGVKLDDSEVIMPDPILVGRSEAKLEALAGAHGRASAIDHRPRRRPGRSGQHRSTSTRRPTGQRADGRAQGDRGRQARLLREAHRRRLRRGACALSTLADRGRASKNGVVQDKLWLPGLLKLKTLIDTGFFGEILSVRGEFGYWVFEGDIIPPQRPSWNYRKEDGGGIIVDMLCHWRYVLDNLFGGVKAVCAWAPRTSRERWDEAGKPYACTADDSAYATFELEGGIIAHFNSSWCVRVRRDDLLTAAGGRHARLGRGRPARRAGSSTTAPPRGRCGIPDIDQPDRLPWRGWQKAARPGDHYDNAFKVQWELFLRHVVKDTPFRWDLREGAKGVQLAEKGLESWQKRACGAISGVAAVAPRRAAGAPEWREAIICTHSGFSFPGESLWHLPIFVVCMQLPLRRGQPIEITSSKRCEPLQKGSSAHRSKYSLTT